MTNMGNASGLALDDMENVDFLLDRLSATMKFGVIPSGSELARTIARNAPAMAELTKDTKAGIDAIAGMTTTMTQLGVPMAEAQTQLKAVTVEMLNAEKRAKLLKLNLKGMDPSGKVLDWPALLKSISGNMEEVMGIFTSSEAENAIRILAKNSGDLFAKNMEDIRQSGGTALEMYGRMEKTGKTASERLSASWDSMLVNISGSASGFVSTIETGFAQIFNSIARFFEPIENKIARVNKQLNEFQDVIVTTDDLITQAFQVQQGEGDMENLIKDLTAALPELAKGSKFAADEIHKILSDDTPITNEKLQEILQSLGMVKEAAKFEVDINVGQQMANANKLLEQTVDNLHDHRRSFQGTMGQIGSAVNDAFDFVFGTNPFEDEIQSMEWLEKRVNTQKDELSKLRSEFAKDPTPELNKQITTLFGHMQRNENVINSARQNITKFVELQLSAQQKSGVQLDDENQRLIARQTILAKVAQQHGDGADAAFFRAEVEKQINEILAKRYTGKENELRMSAAVIDNYDIMMQKASLLGIEEAARAADIATLQDEKVQQLLNEKGILDDILMSLKQQAHEGYAAIEEGSMDALYWTEEMYNAHLNDIDALFEKVEVQEESNEKIEEGTELIKDQQMVDAITKEIMQEKLKLQDDSLQKQIEFLKGVKSENEAKIAALEMEANALMLSMNMVLTGEMQILGVMNAKTKAEGQLAVAKGETAKGIEVSFKENLKQLEATRKQIADLKLSNKAIDNLIAKREGELERTTRKGKKAGRAPTKRVDREAKKAARDLQRELKSQQKAEEKASADRLKALNKAHKIEMDEKKKYIDELNKKRMEEFKKNLALQKLAQKRINEEIKFIGHLKKVGEQIRDAAAKIVGQVSKTLASIREQLIPTAPGEKVTTIISESLQMWEGFLADQKKKVKDLKEKQDEEERLRLIELGNLRKYQERMNKIFPDMRDFERSTENINEELIRLKNILAGIKDEPTTTTDTTTTTTTQESNLEKLKSIIAATNAEITSTGFNWAEAVRKAAAELASEFPELAKFKTGTIAKGAGTHIITKEGERKLAKHNEEQIKKVIQTLITELETAIITKKERKPSGKDQRLIIQENINALEAQRLGLVTKQGDTLETLQEKYKILKKLIEDSNLALDDSSGKISFLAREIREIETTTAEESPVVRATAFMEGIGKGLLELIKTSDDVEKKFFKAFDAERVGKFDTRLAHANTSFLKLMVDIKNIDVPSVIRDAEMGLDAVIKKEIEAIEGLKGLDLATLFKMSKHELEKIFATMEENQRKSLINLINQRKDLQVINRTLTERLGILQDLSKNEIDMQSDIERRRIDTQKDVEESLEYLTRLNQENEERKRDEIDLTGMLQKKYLKLILSLSIKKLRLNKNGQIRRKKLYVTE
jgi:hypothetical protein